MCSQLCGQTGVGASCEGRFGYVLSGWLLLESAIPRYPNIQTFVLTTTINDIDCVDVGVRFRGSFGTIEHHVRSLELQARAAVSSLLSNFMTQFLASV